MDSLRGTSRGLRALRASGGDYVRALAALALAGTAIAVCMALCGAGGNDATGGALASGATAAWLLAVAYAGGRGLGPGLLAAALGGAVAVYAAASVWAALAALGAVAMAVLVAGLRARNLDRDNAGPAQLQAELRRSEARVRRLIDANMLGVGFWTRDGGMAGVNEALREIIGYERADLDAGRVRWTDITPPEYAALDAKALAEISATGRCLPYEKEYIRKDGTRVPVVIGSAALPGEDGGIFFVLDISERKAAERRLQRSEQLFSKAFHASPDGMTITRLDDNRFVDVNQAFVATMGIERDEAIGRTAVELGVWRDPALRNELVAALRRDGRVVDREISFLNRRGEWCELSFSAERVDIDGAPHMLVATRDIGPRKRMEAALRASEQRLRTVIDQSPLGIQIFSTDGVCTLANDAWEQLWGSARTELVGYNIRQDPQLKKSGAADLIERAFAGETVHIGAQYYEPAAIGKRGRPRWVQAFCYPVKDDQGTVREVVLVFEDVTAREQADAALRAGAERLRRQNETLTALARAAGEDTGTAGDATPDRVLARIVEAAAATLSVQRVSLWLYDENGAAMRCHDLYTAADRRHSAGMTLAAVDYPHYFAALKTERTLAAVDARTDPRTCEFASSYLTPLGIGAMLDAPIWVRGRMVGVVCHEHVGGARDWASEEQAFAGSIADIAALALATHERRRVEAALRQSEARLRRMLEASMLGIVLARRDGAILEANDAFLRIVGYTRADVVRGAVDWPALTPAPYRAGDLATLAGLQARGTQPPVERDLVRKDGSEVPVLIGSAYLGDDTADVAVSFVVDLSERRQAERQIRFQAQLLDMVGQAVIATDLAGKVIYWNRFAETLYGWRADEVHGRSILELTPAAASAEQAAEIMRRLARGERWSGEFLVRRRDGSEFLATVTDSPIVDERGELRGIIGVSADITERRQLEADRTKMQKLESIGVLAGGIAHDFNNLLTAILGNISLTKMFVRALPNAMTVLEDAERAVWRARDLTQQLLTFAKGGAPVRKPGELAPLIVETVRFTLTGANVGCNFAIADDLLPVSFDAGQMTQVLNNLVINAKQAMPAGGTIDIAAANTHLTDDALPPLAAGRYVKITVADRGSGIAPEHLPKIFDPYFTTKQRGSGLGLATSYSIVARHGGHIAVESALGRGSTFTIYLPATDEQVAAAVLPALPAAGSGRILLMDDDASVRDIGAQLLASLGYEAVTASDGAEALSRYAAAQREGRPFAAVILDLTIPGGIGGVECLVRLRDLNADVRALVSSGYSNDPIMAEYARHGFAGVIAKPYRLEELGAGLQRILPSADAR